MHRRLIGFMIFVLVLSTPVVPAHAASSTYIIFDAGKKGIEGLRLFTDDDGITVTAGKNGNDPGTSGKIEDPGKCVAKHYHGTLFGRNDPYDTDKTDHCGWGKVVLEKDASELLKDMSKAVEIEFSDAREAVQESSPDFGDIAEGCRDSAAQLELAKAEVSKKAKAEDAEKINKSLDKAKEHDADCEKAADKKDKKDVVRALKAGLDAKAKAFDKMRKAGGLLP